MKSILDRNFKYVPAAKTDIRKLFKRIERQRKEAGQRNADVLPMKARVK